MAQEKKQTDELTGSQMKAITELIAGSTVAAAAEASGVDRRSIYRWLRDDHEFIAALNLGRSEVWQANIDLRAELERAALHRLREILDGDDNALAYRACALLVRESTESRPSGETDPEVLRAKASSTLLMAKLGEEVAKGNAKRGYRLGIDPPPERE